LLSSISTGGNSFEDIGIQQNFTPPPPGTPEPATWAMMLLGFAGMGFLAYRKRGAKTTLSAA
jgi:hypothetical protein